MRKSRKCKQAHSEEVGLKYKKMVKRSIGRKHRWMCKSKTPRKIH